MNELIKRLERVIQTGAPDKDGMHPIAAEVVLEVVKELSELSTNLAEVGTDLISRQAAIDAILRITNCKSVRELFEYNQEHHLTEMWSGGVNDAIDAVIGVESATDNNVGTKLGTNLAPLGTDCISRQQTIDALCNDYCGGHQDCKYYPNCENLRSVQKLPSAQPAEPKRGKWIRTGSGSLYDHYECSECGKAPKWECMGDNRWKIAFTDFCPNCGCRMDGGEQ